MRKRIAAMLLAVCLLLPHGVVSAAAAAVDADRAADMAAWRMTAEDLLPSSDYWVQNWQGVGGRGLHAQETADGLLVHIGGAGTATLGWCLSRPMALDGLHLYLRDIHVEGAEQEFSLTFSAEGPLETTRGDNTLRFDFEAGSLRLGETVLITPGNTVIRSMGAGQDVRFSIAAQGALLRLSLTTPTGTATADFAPPACADAAYLNFNAYYTDAVISFRMLAAHGGHEPCVPMTPDYDAVRYAVDSSVFNNHNWWGDRLVRANLGDGGLRVRIQSDATGHIGVLYAEKVSFDGLSLNFGRVQGGGDNSNLCLILGDEPGNGFSDGANLLIILNFTKGTLYAYPPAGGVNIIPENDFIKSLADGKTPFRISVSQRSDKDYDITVDTVRQQVSGVLSADCLGDTVTASPDATQLYLSCHGSNDVLEFDLLSLRHGDMRDFGTATRRLYDAYINNAAYAAQVRERIDALGNISLQSGAAIEALEAAYAALYDPSLVTNASSLTAARRRYDALFAAAVKAAAPAEYDRRFMSVANEYLIHNAHYTVTNADGGVRIGAADAASWASRVVYGSVLSVDGLCIELTGHDSLRSGAIALGLLTDTNEWTGNSMQMLLLYRTGGKGYGYMLLVDYGAEGQSVSSVVFDEDIWKQDRLVVEWRPVGDGDTLVLLVNGQKMATLSKSKDLYLASDGACYAGFGYWNETNGDAAYTVVGMTAESDLARVEAAEKAIRAIGAVTEDSGAVIETAEKAYKALPARLKRGVEGYEVLADAIAAYDLLLTGTTGTTLPTGDPTTQTAPAPGTQTQPPVTHTTDSATAPTESAGTTAVGTAPTQTPATTAPSSERDSNAVGALQVAAVTVGALAAVALIAAVILVILRSKR